MGAWGIIAALVLVNALYVDNGPEKGVSRGDVADLEGFKEEATAETQDTGGGGGLN